jgi:hypothetical protein
MYSLHVNDKFGRVRTREVTVSFSMTLVSRQRLIGPAAYVHRKENP